MTKDASFLYSTEFEQLAQQAFKGLEGTSYEARIAIAQLLGFVMAESQRAKPTCENLPFSPKLSISLT